MTIEEMLRWVERILAPQFLTDTQKIVLELAWQNLSYAEMATRCDYGVGYLKSTGSSLWQELSKLLGQKVTKKSWRTVVEALQVQKNAVLDQKLVDWGEAIAVNAFYGRESERELLKQWLGPDHCRLVGIFALGGMGKTTLSIKVAQEMQWEFESVIWRSLRDAPLLTEFLPPLLALLGKEENFKPPENLGSQLSHLLNYLRQQKVLLVLDNFDALFAEQGQAAQFRAGYEIYGELLKRIGEIPHQSCLLLTSREKPLEMAALEGDRLAVRSLNLKGLDDASSQQLLKVQGLSVFGNQVNSILKCYRGNPLAIKMVATTIQESFGGDIRHFINREITNFAEINLLIDKHLNRLTEVEKTIMFWLTINRESISLAELQSDLTPQVTLTNIMEALESLQRRSLLESSRLGFTQQPVIMEFVTQRLIQMICREITSKTLELFSRHALIKATSKDYIRDSQTRLILVPIIEKLLAEFTTRQRLQAQLNDILEILRAEYVLKPSYGTGNLINLFRQLKLDLTGYDFSKLCIRQAYLQDIRLQQVNFSQAEFKDCVWAETFGGMTCVTFSRDGHLLATSDTNGDLQVWDSRNFQQLTRCQGHVHWVLSVCFNPEGSLLASGGQDQNIRIWDVKTGNCLKILSGHQGVITAIDISPDGEVLASSSQDNTVKLWSLPQGKCLQTITGHGAWVWSVKFGMDGQTLFTASQDKTIKEWQLSTGNCLRTLTGHEHWVGSLAISPDGQTLASGSFDQTVKLWHLPTAEVLHTLRGHAGSVTAIAFSPDGQTLASASYDQSIRLWNVVTGHSQKALHKHSSRLWSVAFHPDGERLVSGGDDHAACIWQLRTGNCIKTLQGHSNCVYSLALSPDGNILATAHESHVIHLWDVQDPLTVPSLLKTLQGHQNRIFSVVFSADGQTLISGSGDRSVKIWDWQGDKCLYTLAEHQSWVWSVAVSPDAQTLASGSYDHTIKLWNQTTGHCTATLKGHPSAILSVKFSPDGQILASAGYDQMIKLWDVATQTCIQTLTAHGNRVWSVDFSPDGQQLVTGGDDQTLKLWDWRSGHCLKTFSGHQDQVLMVCFNHQGTQLLSCSGDNTIKIWDIASNHCQSTLASHHKWIWSIQPHPDNQRLFSGSHDEIVKVWDLNQGICQHNLRVSRPYEQMLIENIRGLTEAQQATLIALGAQRTAG